MKKIKVLMVDDEEKFRITTKKILDRKGCETILAESGEEALKKLAENPDVIILDVKMKGIDGYETLKEIQKIYPKIPIIMLTGHATKSAFYDKAFEQAFDYLIKPCDIDVLISKIKDAYQQQDK